jgi:hypothetical protein
LPHPLPARPHPCRWVNAAPKASGFDVATTAISLFASTDAAWNTLATTGLGPITSLEVITKGSNAKNQQQALLKVGAASLPPAALVAAAMIT